MRKILDTRPLLLLFPLILTAGGSSLGNDACIDALPLAVPSTIPGDLSAATKDAEVWRPVCPGNPGWKGFTFGLPGVWYEVIGTGNRMTATTCNPGTTADTSISVYCGTCDRPVCVIGNDNTPSPFAPACEIPAEPGENLGATVSWCSRAGQPYRIWVARWDYAGTELELSVTDSGVPCWGGVDCTPVEVVATDIQDHGDQDGWADTNETVRLRVRLFNRSGVDLTGLEARLAEDDPRIACIANPVVEVGDLAAGESRLAPGAFIFRVADANRTDVLEDFSAGLRFTLAADQFADVDSPRCSESGLPCSTDADCVLDDVCENMTCELSGDPCSYVMQCAWPDRCTGSCSRSGAYCYDQDFEIPGWGTTLGCDGPEVCVDESQEIRIDLDLDAIGGTGRTTFSEGFDSTGLGSFTEMNLDAGLYTLETADGCRCQYNDPDHPFSNSPGRTTCHPGPTVTEAEAYHWHVDDERSFTGSRSLHMGIDRGGGYFTTPVWVMEAVGTEQPVNLASGRTCSSSGTVCTDAGDCPGGEECLAVVPELSFKHQANLYDWRSLPAAFNYQRGLNTWAGKTADRGVVQAQLADASGAPVGPWIKLEPYVNRYNAQNESAFIECAFDPMDDGNTEDDLFDPAQPKPRGPSSTCFAEYVFSSSGDTFDPFDPDHIGLATDGPGLQGETGLGTWVESRVNLAPFRGRRIRLRYLNASVEHHFYGTPTTAWDGFHGGFGDRHDDGWWIDDVTVSHVLTSPATIAVDTKDNTALAADADADCVGDTADCAPGNGQTWGLPDEVRHLSLSHTGGIAGTTTLTWDGPVNPGGTSVSYTTVVKESVSCTETSIGPTATTADTTTPPTGVVRRFLVRADNECGEGPLGSDSSYKPRQGCS